MNGLIERKSSSFWMGFGGRLIYEQATACRRVGRPVFLGLNTQVALFSPFDDVSRL